jgi:uncharacterized membrane protein
VNNKAKLTCIVVALQFAMTGWAFLCNGYNTRIAIVCFMLSSFMLGYAQAKWVE